MTADGFFKHTLRVCVLGQALMLFAMNQTNAHLRRSLEEDTAAMIQARLALVTCRDLLRRPSETLRDGRPKGVVWRRFLPPKKLMD